MGGLTSKQQAILGGMLIAARLYSIKLCPYGNKPSHSSRSLPCQDAHSSFVTQASTGYKRILSMEFRTIISP
jgi:hypothetical protein